MTIFLLHHGEAVGPDVDPRRPLSLAGQAAVESQSAEAASRGARPSVVWHSGKLRAKQTAEAFWRACNAMAELSATRDLQPDDPPKWIRDRLRGETQDIAIVGHYPHLPRLYALLTGNTEAQFPQHGIVALSSTDAGESWKEIWKIGRRGW